LFFVLLSQTAEYALRAMAWLALESPRTPVRAKDLAASTGIPLPYLSKILRRLVVADLLESQKGQGGGFSLARPPREITFEAILSAIDAYPDQGRCAFGLGDCSDLNPCPLHASWSRLSDAVHDWASATTLADVERTAAFAPR
jgi:Rrf2 family iron-sulfur cluster assembly transcriptional regulator